MNARFSDEVSYPIRPAVL